MKNLLYLFSLILILSIGCKKDSQERYELLKEKNYAKLSNDDKKDFKSGLALTMKESPNYESYKNTLRKIAHMRISRSKANDKKQFGSFNRKNLSEVKNYYKFKGIKDPEALMGEQINAVYYLAKLLIEFPELKKLDPQSRKQVWANAGNIWTVDDMKKVRQALNKK